MKKTRLHRLAALTAALALTVCLAPRVALAASATVATGDALIEKLAASGISEVVLAADITTSANLSVSKPVDLAGHSWTIAGGTVSVSSAVSGGGLALTGSALVTITGSVSGGVQVGANAVLCRDTASLGSITGAGTVRVLSTIPGLAAAAQQTELVQLVSYADGSSDSFSSPSATAASAFCLLAASDGNYAAPKAVASVVTDAGVYVSGAAAGTLLMRYSVSYRLDGGAEDPKKPQNPTSYTSEDSFTLSDPVKDGYRFSGWTGAGVTEPATPFTVPAGTSGDLVLTAHWTAATPGGGTGSGGGGFSVGSLTGAAGAASDSAGEAESASLSGGAAPSGAQNGSASASGSGTRVSQGTSGTKVRITSADAGEEPTLSSVLSAREGASPWPLIAGGALLAAAGALLLVFMKRRSDERMRLLMERLNIREEKP